MSDSLHLGPFELAERIGEGGMGAVFAARHVETDQPVAVKLLLPDAAEQSANDARFRREVQALAKLHHPAISGVLDYGTIDDETARRGPEDVTAGNPWFAMEYVEGQSLASVAGSWRWHQFESFLRTTLDALAHAHARSIVHRDLKPSNVLVEDAGSDQPKITLVDFGLARVFEVEPDTTEERTEWVVGTPKYMAPEQILGRRRDEGPWTDLYALGCLTWRMVCGTAPFAGSTNQETFENHLRGGPPTFEPRIPVPLGLDGWLRGLLAREVEDRIGHAADAAAALVSLDAREESTGEMAVPEQPHSGNSSTVTAPASIDQTRLETPSSELIDADETEPSSTESSPSEPSPARRGAREETESRSEPARLALPADWSRETPPATAAIVPRAGLKLFALREIPVIDRRAERDRLWEALHEVRTGRQPRLMTLEGEPGRGKTRLAEWLARRVRELGAGQTLRAFHTRSSGPWEGLRGMFQEAFRTANLDRAQLYRRLSERLPAEGVDEEKHRTDARALTEFLRPTGRSEPVEGPQFRFSSPEQQSNLVGELLERLARRRPLVVCFDDLQWGRESIELLGNLMDRSDGEFPMLAVATIRTDVVAELPGLRERLDRILQREDATRISVDPLTSDDHRALVERLLALDPELAESLAERTEGNPMYAIQLLRDWADRGLLHEGDRGFELSAEADVEVSDDIHGLWVSRLRRLVGHFPEEDHEEIWAAIELAAVLGREVSRREWEAIAGRVGLEVGDALRDALVERGLAERTPDGWAFGHQLLVDSIARRVRESGRWASHNRRCAELLEGLESTRGRSDGERRADHWIAAGELPAAIDALFEEFRVLRRRGDYERGVALLERRETLLDRTDVGEEDPRRVENDIEIAGWRHAIGGAPEEILDVLRASRKRAEAIGNDRLVARAWNYTSFIQGKEGRQEEAVESGRKAIESARRAGDRRQQAKAAFRCGYAEFVLGNLDVASEYVRTAHRHCEEGGFQYISVQTRWLMANILVSRGNDRQAAQLYGEVHAASREIGSRQLEMLALNGMGEIARFSGDADRAREYYRRYRRIERELSQPESSVANTYLNLAQTEVMAGRWEVAREQLREAARRAEQLSRTHEWFHLFLLIESVCAAGEGDWERFEENWTHYEEGWPDDARLLRDHPWLLELAGDHCAQHGERRRAEASWELSRQLWERLDDAEAVRRVASKIEGRG